jgi:hypothetical protein
MFYCNRGCLYRQGVYRRSLYIVRCTSVTFFCSRWCLYRQGFSTNGVCTLYGVQQLRTTYYGRIWYLYIVQAVSLHKTSGACTVHENCTADNKSRIHERTILLRFLGIILRVLRLETSVYYVYITNLLKATFAQGGRKSVSRGDCEHQGGKLFRLCPNYVQEFGLMGRGFTRGGMR